MKSYISDIHCAFMIILFIALIIFVPLKGFSCDACNKKLMNEIMQGNRHNTLLAKEMLMALNNQRPLPEPVAVENGGAGGAAFPNILARDTKLSIPPTSYVDQNTKADITFKITLEQGETYIGNGVIFKGFTTNKKIPGPTFICTEGDVVEFVVENKGTIPHGASLHAAYTQTSKYMGKIPPGETVKFKFRATYTGVYMYHCAPGGHAIPMHIIFGQYGMMVVKPKEKKYKMEEVMGKKPDVEIYLLQHEFYASGKDAVEGMGNPLYTAFNGKTFRYVEEPIVAKPGDFVRVYFLNAGPNLFATFHIVGIIWDYAYWQGNPDMLYVGGQSVTTGPSDSWIIDFRVPPDEGSYYMLSHSVGSTDRGAIGILKCDKNAKTPLTILADGPEYSDQQMLDIKSKAKRTISPSEPGSLDVDPFMEYPPGTKEIIIRIKGNSFYPKRVRVEEGTAIKWVNEDVFSYLDGEISGIHNTVGIDGPDTWSSPLLSHAESYTKEFSKKGDYQYVCMPHPYMKGEIQVIEKIKTAATFPIGANINTQLLWLLGILGIGTIIIAIVLSKTIIVLAKQRKQQKT